MSYRSNKSQNTEKKAAIKRTVAAHPADFQRVTNRWSALNLGGVERICGCSQLLVFLTVDIQTTSNCQGLSISLPPSPCLRTGKEIPAFMESKVSSRPPIVSLADQRQNSDHNPSSPRSSLILSLSEHALAGKATGCLPPPPPPSSIVPLGVFMGRATGCSAHECIKGFHSQINVG